MINLLKIRFYLFLFGCIGSRLLFTIISALSPNWILVILGYLALLPVLGWFYIIFFGERDTGLEVFGDKIWWKHLRPIHMLLWAFFAYLAISRHPYAWIVLLVDTLFGLSSFLFHHWSEGNLNVMIQ
jgi:hypothetical protein